jgi:hypothetical protein
VRIHAHICIKAIVQVERGGGGKKMEIKKDKNKYRETNREIKKERQAKMVINKYI